MPSTDGLDKLDIRKRSNVSRIAPAIDDYCWYVLANDKHYGPLKLGYLKKLAEEGILQTNIQVRTVDSEKWLPAEDVPELFSVMTASEAGNRAAEKSAPPDDRSQARAPNIWHDDEQSSVPQDREWRRQTIDLLAQIWRGVPLLLAPIWLKRLLGTAAIIVAAAAIIAWIDANHSLRAAATLLSYFLIWILAIAACVWMWGGGWQTVAAWQQDLAGALRQQWSGNSWDAKALQQILSGLPQRVSRAPWDAKAVQQLLSGLLGRLSRTPWNAPKVVIVAAIVGSGMMLYQIRDLAISPTVQTANQKVETYTLQGLSDGRALELAGAIKKVVFTDEEIENTLMSNKIYRSVRASAPHVYAQIFRKFKAGMHERKSATELNREAMPIVQGFFSTVLPHASDDDLLRFTRFFIKAATTLKRGNPSDCYFIVNPRMANPSLISAIRNRHPQLTDQENQIQAKILGNFSGKTIALPNAINVSLPLKHLMRRLRSRKGIDMNLLSEDNVAPDRYNIYCATLIAMYEETLRLPKIEAVSLLRYFFAPKQN